MRINKTELSYSQIMVDKIDQETEKSSKNLKNPNFFLVQNSTHLT
jgi:hypothetical protein